jgi:hypothetical protein
MRPAQAIGWPRHVLEASAESAVPVVRVALVGSAESAVPVVRVVWVALVALAVPAASAVSAVLDVRAASVVLGGRGKVSDQAVETRSAAATVRIPATSTPATSTSIMTGAAIGTAGAIIRSVPESRSERSPA